MIRARHAGQRGVIRLVRGTRLAGGTGAATGGQPNRRSTSIAPRFAADTGKPDSAAIEQALDEAVRRGAVAHVDNRAGRGDSGFTAGLALRYDIAPALHATLETACCHRAAG